MNTEAPPSPSQRTSGLAIASLVLGILSCLILPAPFAVLLGIAALVAINRDPSLKGNVLAIIGITLAVTTSVIAILAAIAIPGMMKFQGRAKQAECKANLKAIYTAQMSYSAEYDTFAPDFVKMGFAPERGTRYAYLMSLEPSFGSLGNLQPGDTAIRADRDAPSDTDVLRALSVPLAGEGRVGIRGDCPECSFTAVCIGNVDSDAALDVWSISTQDRMESGQSIFRGQPYQEQAD